ncbi:MAG: fructose-bisphosphatase class II, partial [Chloroflexota bacterium]
MDLLRVTEAGALGAARWMGQGDNERADQAAVEAMRRALDEVDVAGTIVIGEGERDQAPMLFIDERVGTGRGPGIDIAVDPVEGTNLVARGVPNALAVIAASERGGLLHAPDTY